MTIPALPRLLLAVFWINAGMSELYRLSRCYQQYSRIRIDSDGALAVLAPSGQWRDAALGNGSVVLGRLAWLRIRLRDGHRCGELLAGNRRQDESWRRFQVIWRHLGGCR